MRLKEQMPPPTMAKPGIPIENPRRRGVPLIPDPMPRRLPTTPVQPVREPFLPVPVKR